MLEPEAFILDLPTILSIAIALSFIPIAVGLGSYLIPANQLRHRILFYWHAYDALTHLFIEAAWLYECFTSYITVPAGILREPHFLGHSDRLYGPKYGSGPSARLWQEYAKADRRWAGADVGIVSLEALTVVLAGPAALYVCYLVYRVANTTGDARARGASRGKLWFVMTVLATAEIYGGWMTFAPEWFSGSANLDTSHPVYLWLYLVFFNILWVIVPGWILIKAAREIKRVFVATEAQSDGKKTN
ncbi:hypothetical protein VTN31DRAFT_7165 [Thermomyces dupontii]|uniref:uncharacterized protein n=1 Tax=Talaromyces thermophilus TaxID=28565 RepID=UPI0037420FA3